MARGQEVGGTRRGGRKTGPLLAGTMATGVCVALLAACGGGSSKVSSPATVPPATSPAGAARTAASPVVVTVANPKLGTILTDARGMVLYTYSGDRAGKTACTGACLHYWPPLLLPAGVSTATPGSGVSGLGTFPRPDGLQVTFRGQPLYTYIGDSRPDETNGQAVPDGGGTWFVAILTPLRAPAAPATTVRTAPPATQAPVTRAPAAPAPTTATTPPTMATTPPTTVRRTPPVTQAPVTQPPATPAPTRPTTPPKTEPPTSLPGGPSY